MLFFRTQFFFIPPNISEWWCKFHARCLVRKTSILKYNVIMYWISNEKTSTTPHIDINYLLCKSNILRLYSILVPYFYIWSQKRIILLKICIQIMIFFWTQFCYIPPNISVVIQISCRMSCGEDINLKIECNNDLDK